MINFIACIDFKGLKGKNIYFESKYHDQIKQDFTQSYSNDYVLYRHNGSVEILDLFINYDVDFRDYCILIEIYKILILTVLSKQILKFRKFI